MLGEWVMNKWAVGLVGTDKAPGQVSVTQVAHGPAPALALLWLGD